MFRNHLPDEKSQRDLLEVRRSLRSLYQKAMATPDLGRQEEYFLGPATKGGYLWHESLNEAFKFSVEILRRTARDWPGSEGRSRLDILEFRLLARYPYWRDGKHYEQSLLKFTKSDDIFVRLAAELACIRHYTMNDKNDLAKRHIDAAFEFIKNEKTDKYFILYSSVIRGIAQRLRNIALANNPRESEDRKLAFWKDALTFILSDPKRFERLDKWNGMIVEFVHRLESRGKGAEAIEFLDSLATRWKAAGGDVSATAKLTSLLVELRERHSGASTLRKTELAKSVFLVNDHARLFYSKGWSTDYIRLVRVFGDDNELFIVCCNVIRSVNAVGLIRLDAKTIRPIGFDVFPSPNSHKPSPLDVESNWGRLQVTRHSGNVYIASPARGIVRFPKNGQTTLWNEKTGLASQQCRRIAVLGDTLYVLVGQIHKHSGLMSVDLSTGESRVIFSSKSDEHKKLFEGRRIMSLAADAKNNILWLGFWARPSAKQQGVIAAYYPKTGKVVNNLFWDRPISQLWKKSDKLLFATVDCLASFDVRTKKATAIARVDDTSKGMPFIGNVVVAGDTVVCGVSMHNVASPFVFKKGSNKPISLRDQLFKTDPQEKPSFTDFFLTRRGLFLLKMDELFLASQYRESLDSMQIGKQAK